MCIIVQTHVLVFTDPESEHHEPALETAVKIAKQFRGEAQVIRIEATDEAILKHFEVKEGHLPSVVVMDVDLMERYPFESGSFHLHIVNLKLSLLLILRLLLAKQNRIYHFMRKTSTTTSRSMYKQ